MKRLADIVAGGTNATSQTGGRWTGTGAALRVTAKCRPMHKRH
jgi:hypothetical protein